MREILFKAKRLDTNTWVHGSLVGDKRQFIIGAHLLVDDHTGRKVIEMKATDIWEVDPETVCQFVCTDKNDQKVFTEAIVKVWRTNDEGELDGEPFIATVVYHNGGGGMHGAGYYLSRNGKYDPICLNTCEAHEIAECWYIEVIGNRFDNPELLTQ